MKNIKTNRTGENTKTEKSRITHRQENIQNNRTNRTRENSADRTKSTYIEL